MILQHLEALNQLRIVLASGSPRRIDLLRGVGLVNIEKEVSNFAEELDKAQFSSGGAYALATARGKAEEVHGRLTDGAAGRAPVDVLIAADTVVVLPPDAQAGTPLTIIEKARDADHARALLRSLSGRQHEVWTGVVIGHRSAATGQWAFTEHTARTVVSVADLPAAFLDAYVGQHEDAWRGKAGAYGIQDLGGSFIDRIDGDYYNVMGLPLHLVCSELARLVEGGELAS